MRFAANISIAILFLISCRGAEHDNNSPKVEVALSDTLELVRQKYFAETASQLRLQTIDKGVDSFEIRIWVSSMFVESDLILFKYSNNDFQTRKIKYYRSPDGVLFSKPEKIVRPEISLRSLLDSLQQIHLDSLLSQQDIPGFVDNVADGVWYSVEIATTSGYKQLTYHCPERFAKKEINNRKFLDLILLLNRYFHFWTPICSTD